MRKVPIWVVYVEGSDWKNVEAFNSPADARLYLNNEKNSEDVRIAEMRSLEIEVPQ